MNRIPLSFTHTATFQVPPEQVWAALTQPAHLDRWDSTYSTVDCRVGGGFVQNFAYGLTRSGVYLAVEPYHRLVQRNLVFGLKRSYFFNNAVTLAPIAEGTHLHVVVDGFEEDEDQQYLMESMDIGWEFNLQVLKAYVETGEDARPTYWRGLLLGLQYISLNPGRAAETGMDHGAYVLGTVPGGPADRAGLRAGDVMTGFDGEPVSNYHAARRLLLNYRPGDSIRVAFTRQGQAADAVLQLGSAIG